MSRLKAYRPFYVELESGKQVKVIVTAKATMDDSYGMNADNDGGEVVLQIEGFDWDVPANDVRGERLTDEEWKAAGADIEKRSKNFYDLDWNFFKE